MSKRVVAIVLLLSAAAATARAAGPPAVATGEFIRVWQVCGPFESRGVLEPVVEDESGLSPATHSEVRGRAWKPVKSADDILDLQSPQVLGDVDHAVAFAWTQIRSDRAGDVILGLGSDDSAMAWWNGRPVLVNDMLRGLNIGQDQLHLKLRKGLNTLLVKVYDDGGGYKLAVDLRSASGTNLTWEVVTPLNDDELLDLIGRKAFLYFWDEADPQTGLVPDNVPGRGRGDAPCSVAAVGFGLTGLCIADSRGWIKHEEARTRVAKTLRFALANVEHERGIFYHFVDMKTGKRAWNSEASTIDTALLLAGALTCRNYFEDREIKELAEKLYARADWEWMLDGQDTLAMAWSPEAGFTPARWSSYCELMILYLLGIGAPSHALPHESWHAWLRPCYTFGGMTYIMGGPLFVHQYSHGWVDFRGKRDAYADYFRNSALATRAHKAFCLSLSNGAALYSDRLWGVTAAMGPKGYTIWGGPPPAPEGMPDGTVVPCAAAGSLPFDPALTMPVLRELYDRHADKIWGRYGFLDAFNPRTGWVADTYIGIDVGATLLMIENLRTGNVWEWFMRSPEIERAMDFAGFRTHAPELDKADLEYLRALAKDTWACIEHFVHPDTQMPYDSSKRGKNTSVTNVGLYLVALAAAREMGLIAPEEALRRAGILVGSLEKLPNWKGHHQCWHGVADLAPSQDDPWISVVDSGNLAMALVTAAQAFPELGQRCRALVESMDWGALYDAHAAQLYGGYNLAKGKINPDWRVDALATDSRAAAFMAVASGKIPADVWNNLRRDVTERHHARFLEPGWASGGLFMQYLTGIFLDERDSLAGRSAANLAYANLQQAAAIGSEVWGWSSSLDPGGSYLGWGTLNDEVVTPHASVLAIGDFPREVFHNLLKLERKGARAPWEENGAKFAFGFRDSVNWRTGAVCADYLVLDQGMLFLSLVNFLDDGLVRKWFHADPSVGKAVAQIPELAQPEGGPNVSVYEPGLGRIVVNTRPARQLDIPPMTSEIVVDGSLQDWPAVSQGVGLATVSFPEHLEFGFPPRKGHFEAAFRLAWDAYFLYIGATVKDDDLVTDAPAEELYRDDAIEIFLDPQNDGFVWGHEDDYQFGFSPWGPGGHPQMYSWFQGCEPAGAKLAARTGETAEGAVYTIEAAIPWAFMGVAEPAAGMVMRGSMAVHTVNKARTSSAKLNWSYFADADRIRLGELRLVE